MASDTELDSDQFSIKFWPNSGRILAHIQLLFDPIVGNPGIIQTRFDYTSNTDTRALLITGD